MDEKTYQALTDLGFHAAEMASLARLVAEACARGDVETARGISQTLLGYSHEFHTLYVTLLAVDVPTQTGGGARVESVSL